MFSPILGNDSVTPSATPPMIAPTALPIMLKRETKVSPAPDKKSSKPGIAFNAPNAEIMAVIPNKIIAREAIPSRAISGPTNPRAVTAASMRKNSTEANPDMDSNKDSIVVTPLSIKSLNPGMLANAPIAIIRTSNPARTTARLANPFTVLEGDEILPKSAEAADKATALIIRGIRFSNNLPINSKPLSANCLNPCML